MTAYRGTPVSEGVAAGELYLPDVAAPDVTGPGVAGAGDTAPPATVTVGDVHAAFAAVAAERGALADQLRAAGRDQEADIVLIGALMAADPALSGPAVDALASPADSGERFPLAAATAAITAAAEAQAAILAALPDPDLAERAGDVRQVGAAVAARVAGGTAAPPEDPFILVRADVDPADLIRLVDDGRLVGAVSVGGGASSHAAIIARGLGLPMLAGADRAVLAAAAGHPAILDADGGELLVDPAPAELARVRDAGAATAAVVSGEARTVDGELVTILCNVASAAETRLGLANGAAGVGLLRTEIPFTRANGWPTRAEHLAALAPVLSLLRGKRAVVRLLDFAGDKVPPFPGAAGLPAFLHAPGALADQLTAILHAGADTDLAIMIPMVRALEEVDLVRVALARAAKAVGVDPPPLGMMVELAATAAAAPAFAGSVDFFSIGTNDLTADVLRRERSALRPSDASERKVLTAIANVVTAAGQAGIGLSVCGDAAADPAVLPLLLALGVRTVSVGAAKVPAVAQWIARADTSDTSDTSGASGASGSPDTGSGRTATPDVG
ncbi:MAG TPA: putative PEP-binding protein [Thermomicrobiales bacterium]|nr:putative PEP-binding protein [Thermomicrobiales bacterium]